MKTDIKSILPEEISGILQEMGEASYRGKQIFQWLHRGAMTFEDMTNLPKNLRAKLEERFFITAPKVISKQVSAHDGTIKYLWGLYDGNSVESVVMQYAHGNTVCISTQVGCRMGCAFCASTIGGLVRSLNPSEMVDQVLFSERDSGKAFPTLF
jgi:23S rRNA (adenine2503-C2)-methyltransferase